MCSEFYKFGPWEIQCNPGMGGRVEALRFEGFDLLTTAPESFEPPSAELGVYEQQPVFGYDDCFPTVDECEKIQDHGELWSRPFKVTEATGRLEFESSCPKTNLQFKRSMIFSDKSLQWKFEVVNENANPVEFIHVVHPLMPVNKVIGLKLPRFEKVHDMFTGSDFKFDDPCDFLLGVKDGAAELMFENVSAGEFEVEFEKEIKLKVEFPIEIFPCLNIWWNNCGHPVGGERCEFAIEPISGPSSNLAELIAKDKAMRVGANDSLSWNINWYLDRT